MLRRLFTRASRAIAPSIGAGNPLPAVADTPRGSGRRPDLHVDPALAASYASDTPVLATDLFPLEDPWPDDPGLEPPEYERLESEGARYLAIPEVRAFRPITFEQLGFPTRIARAAEIARYADWNIEASIPKLFERGATYHHIGYVNGFTADEWALVAGLGASVARMTAKRCGRAVRPVTTTMLALTPLRIVAQTVAAFGGGSRTIFEAGPGMAYLGPLAAALGHRYRCFDVTQAFCLWQHHMLRWCAGKSFAEMTGRPIDADIPQDKQVVNLPWWLIPRLRDRPAMPADFVYSNANLGEMSADARRCVLELSLAMLRDSPIGMLFYIGPGQLAQCSLEQLDAEIAARGFTRIERLPFTGWVARAENAERIAAIFGQGIRHHDPSGRRALYPADLVMRISRTEAPLDIGHMRWISGWDPPYLD